MDHEDKNPFVESLERARAEILAEKPHSAEHYRMRVLRAKQALGDPMTAEEWRDLGVDMKDLRAVVDDG